MAPILRILIIIQIDRLLRLAARRLARRKVPRVRARGAFGGAGVALAGLTRRMIVNLRARGAPQAALHAILAVGTAGRRFVARGLLDVVEVALERLAARERELLPEVLDRLRRDRVLFYIVAPLAGAGS